MEGKASAKYVRIAPRKVRRSIDMIRGRHVEDARRVLYVVMQEGIMDFIERLFGVTPDGGSGLLEAVYFVVVTAVVVCWAWWRRSDACEAKR